MVDNIVKKQHYVWRRYLRSWSSSDDKIFAYFKSQNSIIHTNLMNVGQSRYFYKMDVLSNLEIEVCRQFIESSKNEFVSKFGYSLLYFYKAYSDMAALKTTHNNIYELYPDYDERLRDIEINTFESLHGKFELMGETLLNCKSYDSLKDNLRGDNAYNALLYIAIQYFRTSKKRKDVVKGLSDRPDAAELSNRIMPLISFFIAFLFINQAYGRQDASFCMINNKSRIPFITSDQPVVNTYEDQLDYKGFPKDMEFYYPISPTHALTVQFDQSLEQFRSYDANEEWIMSHNRFMWQHCNDQIYASTRDILELMKKEMLTC